MADAVKERLGIGHAETTPDLKFTAEYVACIGACGMAPVIMVNDGTYGSMTVQKIEEVIENTRPWNRSHCSNLFSRDDAIWP